MVFLFKGEVCGPHGGKTDLLAKTCFQAQNHVFLIEWYEETDWSFYVPFSPEMQHAWVTTLRQLCEVKNPTCISNAVNWQTSALILIISEKKNLQSLQGAEQRFGKKGYWEVFSLLFHTVAALLQHYSFCILEGTLRLWIFLLERRKILRLTLTYTCKIPPIIKSTHENPDLVYDNLLLVFSDG
jgi:hypothetical protein